MLIIEIDCNVSQFVLINVHSAVANVQTSVLYLHSPFPIHTNETNYKHYTTRWFVKFFKIKDWHLWNLQKKFFVISTLRQRKKMYLFIVNQKRSQLKSWLFRFLSEHCLLNDKHVSRSPYIIRQVCDLFLVHQDNA